MGQLTLARDRFGEKPLFIVRKSGYGLAFASEIRARRVAGPWGVTPTTLDRRRLGSFLCYLFSPGHETLLAGVEALRPGHFAEFHFEKERLTQHDIAPRNYYNFHFSCGPAEPSKILLGSTTKSVSRQPSITGDPLEPIRDEAAAVVELYRLLGDAVRVRLLSDVPLGAFLSGGVNSSLVVALMARLQSGSPSRLIAWVSIPALASWLTPRAWPASWAPNTVRSC